MHNSYIPINDAYWDRMISSSMYPSLQLPKDIISLLQCYYYSKTDTFIDDKVCSFKNKQRRALYSKDNILHEIYGRNQISQGRFCWKLRICPKPEYVGNLVTIGIMNMVTNNIIYYQVLNGYKEIDMILNVRDNLLHYKVTNIDEECFPESTNDIIDLNQANNNANPRYRLIVTFRNRTEVQIIDTEQNNKIYPIESKDQNWYKDDKKNDDENEDDEKENINNNILDEFEEINNLVDNNNKLDELLIRVWECQQCKLINNFEKTFECERCHNHYNINLGFSFLTELDYNCIILAQQNSNEWNCRLCTFLNHSALNQCEQCGNHR